MSQKTTTSNEEEKEIKKEIEEEEEEEEEEELEEAHQQLDGAQRELRDVENAIHQAVIKAAKDGSSRKYSKKNLQTSR